MNQISASEVVTFFDIWKELMQGAGHLKAKAFPDGLYYAEAYMKYGCFGINIRRLLNEDEQEILRRFSVEFERTYTRFNDLKQAEAQAREAQIEAALERIRARTMSMQKSDELADTAAHLFRQLNELGIHPYRCNIGIIEEDEEKCQLWSTTNTGDVIPIGTYIPMNETQLFISIYAD